MTQFYVLMKFWISWAPSNGIGGPKQVPYLNYHSTRPVGGIKNIYYLSSASGLHGYEITPCLSPKTTMPRHQHWISLWVGQNGHFCSFCMEHHGCQDEMWFFLIGLKPRRRKQIVHLLFDNSSNGLITVTVFSGVQSSTSKKLGFLLAFSPKIPPQQKFVNLFQMWKIWRLWFYY